MPSNSFPFSSSVTPTVTAGAYSAGDIMGGLLSFYIPNITQTAILDSVQIISKAAVSSNFTLVLFNASPTSTTTTDNAAYSLNVADCFKVITALPLLSMGAVMVDHGTPNSWQLGNLELPFSLAAGNPLYGVLIDGTGVTLSSTGDIQVKITGRGF